MKFWKRKIFVLLTFVAGIVGADDILHAQNMPMYSFNQFSNINFNPASIPVKDYVNGMLVARHQWAGFEGAPKSQMLNLQGYVSEINSSFGTTIESDFFGATYKLHFKGIYAYNFQIGSESFLSLGLGAGFIYTYFDGTKMKTEEGNDPAIPQEIINDVKPDFDFGLAVTIKGFSLGLSARHLTSFLYKDKTFLVPSWGLHAFMQYDIAIGEKHHIIPYLRAYYEGNIFQGEAQLRFDLFDVFWFGAGYRWQDGLIFNAGLRIAKMVGIGYAYDFNLGANKAALKNTKGTHEIMLHLKINSYKKMGESSETPRYFE
jgi:type IX secretion system PorP/SprF family membrane protein